MESIVTFAHAGWGPGGWWFVFPLMWLLLWGFVVFGVFRFRRNAPWGRPGASAEGILAERYARGEISIQEYRERLGALRG